MIAYYYTGARSPEDEQTDILMSLGGFISSTPVVNGFEGNLFPSTSLNNSEKGSLDVSCLALKNIGQTPITSLGIEITGEFSGIISIGLVQPGKDDCGKPYFESIPNSKSLPTFTELTEVERDEEIVVDLSQVPWEKDQFFGLWISRRIEKKTRQRNLLKCLDCDDLYREFTEGTFGESEKEIMKIVFNYS